MRSYTAFYSRQQYACTDFIILGRQQRLVSCFQARGNWWCLWIASAIATVATRNNSQTMQICPVSTARAPVDRLSLLPKELLDTIFLSSSAPKMAPARSTSEENCSHHRKLTTATRIGTAYCQSWLYLETTGTRLADRKIPTNNGLIKLERRSLEVESNLENHPAPYSALTTYPQLWSGAIGTSVYV